MDRPRLEPKAWTELWSLMKRKNNRKDRIEKHNTKKYETEEWKSSQKVLNKH